MKVVVVLDGYRNMGGLVKNGQKMGANCRPHAGERPARRLGVGLGRLGAGGGATQLRCKRCQEVSVYGNG